MTSKTFATLNPNALGPGLALDYGNLVVTTNQNGLDVQRAVFGTIPKAVGHVFAEAYFYSNFRGDLTDLWSFGLAQVDAPLDEMIGGASGKSWGLRDSGEIWNANASIDSSGGQPIAERHCLGLYVNFSGLTSAGPFAAWYVDGSQVGTVILPSGKFWVLGVSIAATSSGAGDLSAFVNFGQRPFENQPQPTIT